MKGSEKSQKQQPSPADEASLSQPAPSSAPRIPEQITITDPNAVPVLFHPEKEKLLKILIQDEYTIIDLSKMTNINPGTIKRHLNDLVDHGLVVQSRDDQNAYGIKLKFYRATAKAYRIEIEWQP